MAKGRPDFADDLGDIQKDVTSQVGQILKIANSVQSTASAPESKPAALPENTLPQKPISSEPIAAKRRRNDEIAAEQAGALVNVTTRLRERTNELLTDAALRQRLKKTKPDTRQEIIEEAVGQWLKKQGYL